MAGVLGIKHTGAVRNDRGELSTRSSSRYPQDVGSVSCGASGGGKGGLAPRGGGARGGWPEMQPEQWRGLHFKKLNYMSSS